MTSWVIAVGHMGRANVASALRAKVRAWERGGVLLSTTSRLLAEIFDNPGDGSNLFQILWVRARHNQGEIRRSRRKG